MSIKNENTAYKKSFYEMQSGTSYKCAKKVIPHIMNLFSPNSVVDVGCGVGTWLKAFQEYGVHDILGIDGEYVDKNNLYIDNNNFIPLDLKIAYLPKRKFDLAISLEVGEHIKESASSIFVETITNLSNVIVFSAAQPLQGGQYHVNEQRPEFREKKFSKKGYVMLDPLRLQLLDYNELGAYRQNIFVFIEKELHATTYKHLRKYNPEIILLERKLFNTYVSLYSRFKQQCMITVINLSIKTGVYQTLSKIYHKIYKN